MRSVTTYMSIGCLTLNRKKLSVTRAENLIRGRQVNIRSKTSGRILPISTNTESTTSCRLIECQLHDENPSPRRITTAQMESAMRARHHPTPYYRRVLHGKIVDYDEIDGKVLHCVRWYGYTADGGTAEPANHTQQLFITKY